MELRIQNLSKTYPNGVRALLDVSLTIPNGMFGLLGPNGAGKSSLMRTIATLQEPDSGSITLGDIDVLQDKDRVRQVLGYLPQEFGLYPGISAEALLDYFASLKGRAPRRRGEPTAPNQPLKRPQKCRGRLLGRHEAALRHRGGLAGRAATHHRGRAHGRPRPH